MKRVLVIPLVCLAATVAIYVVFAVYRTERSITFLHSIQKDIESSNFHRITASNRSDHLNITTDAIIYRHGSRDITHDLQVAEPNFQKILEFYLTDPDRFKINKIVLDGPSIQAPDGSRRRVAGYLTHDDSSIISAKFY